MNAARFLTPKSQVAWLYADCTLRQALEKMRCHGYAAIPVIHRDGKYAGTVSEGDFLWHLIEEPGSMPEAVPIRQTEDHPLLEILVPDRVPPVPVTAGMEQLMLLAMNQNFVPVVDDNGSFIGIVTRKRLLEHFYKEKSPQ